MNGLRKPTVLSASFLAMLITFVFSGVGCDSFSPVFAGGFVQEPGSGRQVAEKTNEQVPDASPFALVELFTSQGCNSCPSADRNLARIAQEAKANGKNIYTLSYHVDYWNYLGWEDPYSSEAFSNRQKAYARQFKSTRIYTPQMVVNGQAEFVGSKQKISDRALAMALEIDVEAAIALQPEVTDNMILVGWQATGIDRGDIVNVALVQNHGTQQVDRGENARRELSHVNIVRQLKTDPRPGESGQVELSIPDGFQKDEFHVVAFIQSASQTKAIAKSEFSDRAGENQRSPMMKGDGNAERVEARKPPLSETQQDIVGADVFLRMLGGDSRTIRSTLAAVNKNWQTSYVPMLLEVGQFLPASQRAEVIRLMELRTSNDFGTDFDKWHQWNWKQTYDQHPQYADFKSQLYRQIDPRFAEYFEEAGNTAIRLDEIRWGGVKRDGIPPLENPKMLAANNAGYLADTDVVFGIELNGDVRAYPKRILAWHEMFKDTIGGESVCGVY
jgi:hypothetical protein